MCPRIYIQYWYSNRFINRVVVLSTNINKCLLKNNFRSLPPPPPIQKYKFKIAEKSEQFMFCEDFGFDLSLFNATYHA